MNRSTEISRLDSGYSTREVARLLATTPRRVRSFVAAGVLAPRGSARRGYRFGFQDLVLLRTARELEGRSVPARRIRRALASLRRQIAPQGSLSAVKVTAEGGRVVARCRGEAWQPESGQRLLPFEPLPAKTTAVRGTVLSHPGAARPERSARQWFDQGRDLEARDGVAAINAYREALSRDPRLAEAHLNLGRLLHEQRDLEAAERHYREATRLRPADATAAFNLGVALQDLGRPRAAIEAYQLALAADPAYADAYFNLAGLYDELGQRAVAIQNLKTYKALTEGG
ncbi:MAG: tetratricopeptide repeat protein [Acidobacteriota bacterium]